MLIYSRHVLRVCYWIAIFWKRTWRPAYDDKKLSLYHDIGILAFSFLVGDHQNIMNFNWMWILLTVHLFILSSKMLKRTQDNMGFISPHGLHIPIVTITRNNILLVKRHICDIGNQFSGVEFDWHGTACMMNIWSTVSSWYRKFYCNNDLYCFHASNYAGSVSL